MVFSSGSSKNKSSNPLESDSIELSPEPWPRPPSSHVDIRRGSPLVIIGIGGTGYEVLKWIVDRARDTLTDLQHAKVHLLHIDVLAYGEALRPSYVADDDTMYSRSIVSAVVIGREDADDGQRNQGLQWLWWKHTSYKHIKGRRKRHTSRVLLYDHLQNSRTDSQLWRQLTRCLRDDSHVAIVGSALEVTGTNVVPDVAALVRKAAEGRVTVHTFALMEEVDKHSSLEMDRSLHQAATVLELGYYRSATPVNLMLSEDNLFHYRDNIALLDTVNCIDGENHEGVRSVFAILWSMCISGALIDKLKVASMDQQNAGSAIISFLNGHGWFAPLFARRELLREAIKLKVISRDYAPQKQNSVKIPSNHNQLVQYLRDNHYDLLTPVHIYNRVRRRAPNPRMKSLEQWLKSMADQTYRQIEDAKGRLKQTQTTSIQRWSDLPVSLAALDKTMVWEVHQEDGFALKLGQGAPRDSDELLDDHPFNGYLALIEELATRRAELVLYDDITVVRSDYISVNNINTEWNNRFSIWETALPQKASGYVSRHRLTLGISISDAERVNGDDNAGLAQFLLTGAVPVGNSRYAFSSVDHLAILEDFLTHTPLLIGFSNLKGYMTTTEAKRDALNLPTAFFTLLSSIDDFCNFFWCWYNETLVELMESYGFDQYQTASWRERISSFLRFSQRNRDFKQDAYTASLKPLDDLPPMLEESTGGESDRPLYDALSWLFDELVELVEVPDVDGAEMEDTDLEALLSKRRVLFELFLCWRNVPVTDMKLRGRNWRQRLSNFEEQLTSNRKKIDQMQTSTRSYTLPDDLSGDAVASILNQVLSHWQLTVGEYDNNLPLFRRWTT